MNYLTVESITKTYGPKILFRDLSLMIDKGQKIALVAKNGTGKSTLMRVLTGEESPEGDTGRIIVRKDIRTGYLMQDPQFEPNQTVLEAIFAADTPITQAIRAYELAMLSPENEEEVQRTMHLMDDLKAWDYESNAKEILHRLKMTDFKQRVGTMSGGQVKRLALAKILIEDPDFFILDEPTNHLDLDMIEWLEQYFKKPSITLLMVTHDRYFLDNVCDHIVELDGGILYRYKGNYGDYLEKKAIRGEVDASTLDKNKKLLKRELDWMRRSPQARTTKAKSRIDGFYELKDKTQGKRDDGDIQFNIKENWLGSKIVELQYVSKSFDDKLLLKDFHYKFARMERVGIIGANGSGKSTLLRMMIGQEKPDGGKVVIGETVKFGYYGQGGLQLDKDKRVIEVITDIAEFIPLDKGAKMTAAQLLERFLFSREQQQVYASQLSGGEKRRLYLLTVLMKNPNFLILDEPTNDLDILTLNVLEDFLQEYPGCVVIVTHDRYFMDKVVDHVFVFEGEGQLRDFPGNYSEYRDFKAAAEIEAKLAKTATLDNGKAKNERSKLGSNEKKEFNAIEKELPKLEKRKIELTNQLYDASLSGEQIMKISTELGKVVGELEEKEMRWLELSEMI